jgi:hypothetical protein
MPAGWLACFACLAARFSVWQADRLSCLLNWSYSNATPEPSVCTPPPEPAAAPISLRFDDDPVTRAKWQNLFLDTVYEVCSNKQAAVSVAPGHV